MLRCAVLFGSTALLVAAVDLVHKDAAGAGSYHPRSLTYVAVVVGLSAAWTTAILATRSIPMAVGGGTVVGGAVGNVASLAVWPGVPNPIVLGAIALNLADIFVFAGFVIVAGTTIALVRGDPERLGRPVRT